MMLKLNVSGEVGGRLVVEAGVEGCRVFVYKFRLGV